MKRPVPTAGALTEIETSMNYREKSSENGCFHEGYAQSGGTPYDIGIILH